MEIKILNENRDFKGNFEPQIIAYMKGEQLVAEIAFNKCDCQEIERDLGQQDYVIGPLSKTIALTNIASLNDLRKLV